MANVVLTDEAKDDLRALDGAQRKVVVKALAKLRQSPEQRGEPLGSRSSGNLTGLRKLVVGDRQYRVVYEVQADNTVCVVWVIGSRVDAECYDEALARIELYAKDPALKASLKALIATAFDGNE